VGGLFVTGEHPAVDDCDVTSSSPTLMFAGGSLQKALHPLQQQQHEIAEQLTALSGRLSALQTDLSRQSSVGLGASGLLRGNDIFIVAALLLAQLMMLWWLVHPESPVTRQLTDTQQ